MRRLPAAIPALAATAFFGAPAFAHHSQAAFDASREILIEGAVARLDWKNPHIYLIVETVGADGTPQLVQGEGLAITQALVDGLHPEAFPPGTPVVVRANPDRGGPGKTVRVLDVTTRDGAIHPFYAANPRTRTLTHPADVEPSLFGHSIGRWEGETLVIDTVAYEPSPYGLFAGVPSSAGKHTIERLT